MQSEGAEGGGGRWSKKGRGECMLAWAGMATTSAANFGH